MGLRSAGLLATLAAAAIVLVAVTLWLWPRLARRGVGILVARAGLLLAVQASVLGLVFVKINQGDEFYASWSDLLGANTGTVAVAAVRGGAGPAATASRGGDPAAPVRTLSTVPVTPPGVARSHAGKLSLVRFTGQVSGITAEGYVYLPPGHGRPPGAAAVLVVISGQAGSTRAAGGAQRIALTAAAQMAAGRLARAIVVVLAPTVGGQADPGCLDVPGGPQAATFFTQDLPLALASAYHVSEPAQRWGVIGLAGGGYCALQLAISPAGEFTAAAVPRGSYAAPPGGFPSAGAPGSFPGVRNQQDVLWQLRHHPPPPVRVLMVGAGPAGPVLPARPPMTVATAGLAAGPWPLAPVLDWTGHAAAGPA